MLNSIPSSDASADQHRRKFDCRMHSGCDVSCQSAVHTRPCVASAKTQKKQQQTDGRSYQRFDADSLSGSCVPLDDIVIRRGTILRCDANTKTCNAQGENICFAEGCLAKVVNIDHEGDAQITSLTPLDVWNLWETSNMKFWLLKGSFGAFSAWLHISAVSEDAIAIRESRLQLEEET